MRFPRCYPVFRPLNPVPGADKPQASPGANHFGSGVEGRDFGAWLGLVPKQISTRVSKNAPSNAGELVGEGDGEDVVVQPFLAAWTNRVRR